MKRAFLHLSLAAALAACAQAPAVPVPEFEAVGDVLRSLEPGQSAIRDFMGTKLDLCIKNRVIAQDFKVLVTPFRKRIDKLWESHYWGACLEGVYLAYLYRPTPEWKNLIDETVKDLLTTQDEGGCITSFPDDLRRKGWELWGRAHVMLGLLAHYDLTGDGRTLEATKRLADSILNEVGPGKADILEGGAYDGMASSIVLEPMCMLYARTGEKRFIEFARYILERWKHGPNLVDRMRKPGTVARRVANVAAGGYPKAYEMLQCYEGVAEMYRVTGSAKYLEVLKNVVDNVIRDERFIVGSGSSSEFWFGGRYHQAGPIYKPMETCVTCSWIRLLLDMLRFTGDPKYADELERTTFNALLGAMKEDGSWWCYYTPMQGVREPSFVLKHPDVKLSCCVSSGPRGLLALPRWAVMAGKEGPVINTYLPGSYTVRLPSGSNVRIEIRSEYPRSGGAAVMVYPERSGEFVLRLRVPPWSRKTRMLVNGEKRNVDKWAGGYFEIQRHWNDGDGVVVKLDMNMRVVPDPGETPSFVDGEFRISRYRSAGERELFSQKVEDGPRGRRVEISANTRKAGEFPLALRIPTWNHHPRLSVNGERIAGLAPGTYRTVSPGLKEGESVVLELSGGGRPADIAGKRHVAIMRGPIVLAATAKDLREDDVWVVHRMDVASQALCDYASAGLPWGREHAVWLQASIDKLNLGIRLDPDMSNEDVIKQAELFK